MLQSERAWAIISFATFISAMLFLVFAMHNTDVKQKEACSKYPITCVANK